MGTDNDVGQPAFRSDGWYAARAAEAEANLIGVRRDRFERVVEAAGVDVDTLSPKARMDLVWMAGWEDPTIEGAIEVLEAARGIGAPSVADVARIVDAIDDAPAPTQWAPECGAA